MPLDAKLTRAVEPLDRSARSKFPAPDTLAVDVDDRLARLDGLEPDTVALDLAARLERSALDVTLDFFGDMLQPTVMVATGMVKPVPAPRAPGWAVRTSPTV